MHRHHRARTIGRSLTGARPGRSVWRRVALLAAVALALIGGREGWQLSDAGWLTSIGDRQPIRAAMNVRAERTDCSVARVIDGDTVDLACPGEALVRARLLGFDTPEVFSPGCASELALGRQATSALEAKIRRAQQVRLVFAGSDRYDRRLTQLYLDGADVAGIMVGEGLARPYEGGRRRSWC